MMRTRPPSTGPSLRPIQRRTIRSRRRLLALLTLALALAVLGCGASRTDSPSGPAAPRALAVVVLGSSTAAAYGLPDPEQGWVARYARHLAELHDESTVMNLAVPAYTTYHVRPSDSPGEAPRPRPAPASNVDAALALSPDAVIVNLPSNDAFFRYSVEESITNLRLVAERLAAAGVDLWVASPQPRNLGPEGQALLAGLRAATQQEFGARALDFWTPLALHDGRLDPALEVGDGIHPNAEGHAKLFEVVRAADLPAEVER